MALTPIRSFSGGMKFGHHLCLALALLIAIPITGHAKDERVFELRTYHAAEGKLDALHARFRDHTLKLFEKHGIENLLYTVPKENRQNQLVYFVAYPSREARSASWKAFLADADWKAAKAASEVEGKLVAKVENRFFTAAGYSPKLPTDSKNPPRLFELRTYTTNPGKLPNIHARFRDHTIELFTKHGIENLIYFDLMDNQPGMDNTLVYLVAHENEVARGESFKAFGSDPAWKTARDDSQKAGPILIKKGVKSQLLVPTDYSPLK